jgi:hypothetical protein
MSRRRARALIWWQACIRTGYRRGTLPVSKRVLDYSNEIDQISTVDSDLNATLALTVAIWAADEVDPVHG